MKPHAVLRSSDETGRQAIHPPAQIVKRLTAFSLALLLLPASQPDLFAQQAPYSADPQQPYSYSYNDQYDPGQQYQQPYALPPPDYGDQQSYDQPQPGYGQQPQGLGADQLEQLVAPIALNPDQLIALMLAASTYPAQVQDADHWRQAQGYVSTDQIAYGASLQAWDPSVKALTAFPQVLAEMDQNIQWTAALGNAYYNQPQDVLQAIQIMRQRAQAAGNLQSTPQESVSYNQGYIQVAPVNPQVIYVPAYNPWTVYGQPVDPYPGFSLLGAIGSFFSSGFGSSAVQFGLGTVLSAFSHTPFGLLAWGLDWLSQNLLFHSNNYYSHSASVRDWGLPYGGPRAHWAPRRELAGYNRGDGRGYGQGFNRAGNYTRGYQSGYSNRNQQTYNRSYQTNRSNYGYRNGLYNQPNRAGSAFTGRPDYGSARGNPSWNRSFAPIRPQPVGRSAYGSSYGSNYRSNFNSRSQLAYSGGTGLYNSNRSGFNQNFYNSNRGGFNQHSDYRSNAFAGNGFNGGSGKSSHSGGFQPFGGGHNSNGFGGGQSFKAPKAPKGFGGGGHSFGGGHSHGGGGGHSHGGGGGGHHSGGGHHH
jgi:Protein of unknown function (DUF3300)